jgi:hypothetical protein
MNFQNPKEVIVKNGPKNINLFHFLHRCHGLGDSKESLSPIFSVFMISCLRHVFATRIRPAGDEFQETERGFSLERDYIQNPFSYFTQCYSLRITSGILKPIFHNFAS